MCLVEVERSPKPVASWYGLGWMEFTLHLPFYTVQCNARNARFESMDE